MVLIYLWIHLTFYQWILACLADGTQHFPSAIGKPGYSNGGRGSVYRLIEASLHADHILDIAAMDGFLHNGTLSRLPNKGHIQYVTMDMWQPYKDAVKATLAKATIIVDKFHVVRMANQSLETVRKQLREDLSPKQRRGLMHDRFILLKRHKELSETDKITLEIWTKNHPPLGVAYELKESFFDIWDCNSRQMACFKYKDWKAKIPKNIQSAFEPLTKAFTNWEQEIFAYFDHRITNALY